MTITTPKSARPASVATATTRRTQGAEDGGIPADLDVVHAGPGTLAGRYLRQFWQPVALGADVAPGTARTIRVLGEEFTLYRGQSGTPFLVDHRCAHRGAQLSLGWVEDDCLRCFYHGWKYDSSGQCVEQIAEDP